MTLPGCFTTRVNSLVDRRPKAEKLVKIDSAYVMNDNIVDIVFTGKFGGKRKENKYNVRLNIDTVVSMNTIPNTSVNPLPEIAQKTGVLKIDYVKENDTSFYLVYLGRIKATEINNKPETFVTKDITPQLKTDINYRYDGFNSENQIIITYFPENKKYYKIAFGLGNHWKNKKWGYLLYPFSIAMDVITFPVQFIYLLANYKHPFKN